MSGSTKARRDTLKIFLDSSIMSAVFIRWNALIAVSPSRVLCFSFQGGPQIVGGRFKVGTRRPGVRRDHALEQRHFLGGIDRQRTDNVRAAHRDNRELSRTVVAAD